MNGLIFWIATATDKEGDLHWIETLAASDDLDRVSAERDLRELAPSSLPASCTVEVFGPFRTPRPKPAEYDGAAHIFNWARNSGTHYKRMLGLKSGQYIRETGRAADASNLAWQTVTEATRAEDIDPAMISATDILRAGIMFLEWDGES